MGFRFEKNLADTLTVIFSGRLEADSIANIWSDCLSDISQARVPLLILDFTDVDYCDGAGVALIIALQKQQSKHGGKCKIEGLKEDFQRLLKYIEEQPDKIDKEKEIQESLLAQLGRVTVDIFNLIRDNIIFIGMLSYQLFFSLCQLKKIRWYDIFRIAEDIGPRALPIIALIGFLIGLISTFQAAPSFADFGVQIYMVDLVGLGLVREMGPLLTSVLLAGRTASSFAAEIGTMKINQEIDALSTMGLNPIRFLVIPRILVTMFITPLLEVFFIIFGLLGCLVVMLSLGYTADAFFNRLHQAVVPMDYIGGLVKVFVFGIVIASVGCLHGIKTRFGAQAVGHSTTQAVVSSMIMLVLVDGIFALVYYVLGV